MQNLQRWEESFVMERLWNEITVWKGIWLCAPPRIVLSFFFFFLLASMNWIVAENQATCVCVFGSWTILLQIYFVKSSTILYACQFCTGSEKYLTIFFNSRTVWENVWWWKDNLLGSEVPFSSLKQRCILSNFLLFMAFITLSSRNPDSVLSTALLHLI